MRLRRQLSMGMTVLFLVVSCGVSLSMGGSIWIGVAVAIPISLGTFLGAEGLAKLTRMDEFNAKSRRMHEARLHSRTRDGSDA